MVTFSNSLCLLIVPILLLLIPPVFSSSSSSSSCVWQYHSISPPSYPITFVIALKQSNVQKLESLLWSISDPLSTLYQQFLTVDEINSIVGTPKKHIQQILEYFYSYGIKDNNIQVYSDALRISTTVETVQLIFGGEWAIYRCNEFNGMTNKAAIRIFDHTSYHIPSEISEYIGFLEGLHEFPPTKAVKTTEMTKEQNTHNTDIVSGKNLMHENVNSAGVDLIIPPLVSSLYNVPSASSFPYPSQHPINQAVAEWDQDFFNPTDLFTFGEVLSYYPLPNVSYIISENNPQLASAEGSMDTQWISAMNPEAINWFIWNSNYWMYEFALSYYNMASPPLVLSLSWGLNEEETCVNKYYPCSIPGGSIVYMTRTDVEWMKLALRGVSVFACTQDSGANGRSNRYCTENHLNVAYPASSPYVTAVGATQITPSQYGYSNIHVPGSYALVSNGTERVVTLNYARFTTGGGFSNYSTMPLHQQQAVHSYLKRTDIPFPSPTYYNSSNRAIPDISAVGARGWCIISNSSDYCYGTSLSTPIIAGLMGQLVSYSLAMTGKPLGLITPLLYHMWEMNKETFNDIIIGDNNCTESLCSSSCQGYTASPGWDATSGLGTPNLNEMINFVGKLWAKKKHDSTKEE